ncbi:MAG: hypothetical protein N0C90_18490 [Candidatus Thiodiazotropha endolucinida]|nr:hypothetical protein [Candidatus Thiodiazotropha taylori]MCG8049027.1 hypothetical protein [Candidatus Thiodiazotropha taylori]MCG8049031.1 hypothetical protein [Candidatus Thiodiazotropha taylori]MCW4263345.1 hypothetical protein [Candidatus Thiodiazotropha endolucinida]MCW4346796.1 hypothetical protein [Candidatus Thiodiazotropha endolucinida]
MSLEQEISGINSTLDLLGEEKNNLIKHFEIQIKDKLSALKTLLECVEQEKDLICQLKIQEENYFAAVMEYKEKVQKLLNLKDQKISALEQEKNFLEQHYIPQSQEATQSYDV